MHLKKALFLFCLISNTLTGFTLLLQSVGDARYPGRSIHGSYERGLSIQLGQMVQEMLLQKDPSLTIIIPRPSGQTVEPNAQASIANRLGIDAAIAFMLYEQQESTPHLAIYTYATDPSDMSKKPSKAPLQFIPFDQAHIGYQQASYQMAHMLLASFTAKPVFTIEGGSVHALPLKNLMGITAPSVAIELSVPNLKSLKAYAQSLADALWVMITSLKEKRDTV